MQRRYTLGSLVLVASLLAACGGVAPLELAEGARA
jgi:hypothetical protein